MEGEIGGGGLYLPLAPEMPNDLRKLALAHCPTLVAEATTLFEKFRELFRLFALQGV